MQSKSARPFRSNQLAKHFESSARRLAAAARSDFALAFGRLCRTRSTAYRLERKFGSRRARVLRSCSADYKSLENFEAKIERAAAQRQLFAHLLE